MKKTGLFLSFILIIAIIGFSVNSCMKKDNQMRLAFSVDSITQNVYVGDTGYTHWLLKASFLNGNPQEALTISFTGLPARVTISPDSLSAVPTFYQDFVFHGNWATHGVYPASLIAFSPSAGTKVYNFNLVVVTANCGVSMSGVYDVVSGCNTAYNYVSTISPATGQDSILINNIGGYGTNTNAVAKVNCGTDSVFISYQNIGNNVMLRGKGVFDQNHLTIYYYTPANPYGNPDSCIASFTRR